MRVFRCRFLFVRFREDGCSGFNLGFGMLVPHHYSSPNPLTPSTPEGHLGFRAMTNLLIPDVTAAVIKALASHS